MKIFNYLLNNQKPVKKILNWPVGYFIQLPQKGDDIFVDIYIKAGAITEQKVEAGIGHLLEHYLASLANDRLAGQVDIKARINDDFILFYFVIKNDHQAIETIKTMLNLIFKPNFDDDKIFQLEKQSIIDEVKKEIDDDDFVFERLVEKTRYLDEANSRSFVDHLDNLNNLNLKNIESYHRLIFTNDNVVVFLSGSTYDQQLAKVISDELGKFNLPDGKAIYPKPQYSGFEVITKFKQEVTNNYLAVTFPCPNNALSLKESQILSIIMLAIKNTHQDRFYVNYHRSQKNGYLIIQTRVLNDEVIDCFKDIADMLKKLKKEGLNLNLLKTLKKKRVIEEDNDWLDNHERFIKISHDLLKDDKVYSLSETKKMIKSIELEEVKALAGKIFDQTQTNIVVYGQFEGLKDQLNKLNF
jgi:predicted Zn-dependent peptidase